MLGAYLRSQVLWSIRIVEPKMFEDDSHLLEIALAAYCLRQGWVWLNIHSSDRGRQLISYSQDALEQALVDLTA